MRPYFMLQTAATALLVAAAATAHAGSVDKVLPASPNGVVEVSNVSGKVEVRGWDRAEVSVRGEYGGGVQRVEIMDDHGHIIIKVVTPSFSFSSGGADLKIQVPRGSELNVSAVSADVTSADVQGIQRLKTVSGEITADVGERSLDANSVSGDIHLRGHGTPVDMHIGTISGTVHLEHGAGSMEINTVSGDMVINLDTAKSLRVHTTSGDFRLQAGSLVKGATIDAESISGDVRIKANSEAGFEYDLSSFSGDISNCFHVEAERPSYGPGSRLRGERGEGAAHVRIKTMSGDIGLCDKS